MWVFCLSWNRDWTSPAVPIKWQINGWLLPADLCHTRFLRRHAEADAGNGHVTCSDHNSCIQSIRVPRSPCRQCINSLVLQLVVSSPCLAHPIHQDSCRRALSFKGEKKNKQKPFYTFEKKYNHIILHPNYTHHFQSVYLTHKSQVPAVLPALCYLSSLMVIGGGWSSPFYRWRKWSLGD